MLNKSISFDIGHYIKNIITTCIDKGLATLSILYLLKLYNIYPSNYLFYKIYIISTISINEFREDEVNYKGTFRDSFVISTNKGIIPCSLAHTVIICQETTQFTYKSPNPTCFRITCDDILHFEYNLLVTGKGSINFEDLPTFH